MNGVVFHLGRTPDLSIQEIELIFSKPAEVFANGQAALVDISALQAKDAFPEIGGSLRAGEVLFRGRFEEAVALFSKKVLEENIKGKKQKVGIHVLPADRSRNIFQRLFSELKKKAKEGGHSLRIVNRGDQTLDSFAVRKEHLLDEGNGEFWLVLGRDEAIVAKTIEVQHPEEFSKRDYGKPQRDMQVGMLPPKLAMMMLNFARENGKKPSQIYDPFCGTGTMLTEARAMGIVPMGSDRSRNMVEATRKNAQYFFPDEHLQVFAHDVIDPFPEFVQGVSIVSEGFLGNMYSKPISDEQFFFEKDSLFPMYDIFLRNAAEASISRVVLAIPFWKGAQKEYSFSKNLLEAVQKYGYMPIGKPIRYRRPEQVVGREVLVLRKESV